MRSLKAPYKDWRRRRALERGGVRPDLAVPGAIALGERSGTWVFDPRGLTADSVVYAGGVGDNIAWDLGMVERFGVTVHAFDPTPRSVAWLAQQDLPPGFVHHALGLAGADGERRFEAPAKERSANYTLADSSTGAGTSGTALLPVARLATVARELGHERIDLLKLDIEGAEYEVLEDALEHGPEFDQLLVEFHHGEGAWRLEHTLRAVAALRANGLRLFHVSRRGLELSFVKA